MELFYHDPLDRFRFQSQSQLARWLWNCAATHMKLSHISATMAVSVTDIETRGEKCDGTRVVACGWKVDAFTGADLSSTFAETVAAFFTINDFPMVNCAGAPAPACYVSRLKVAESGRPCVTVTSRASARAARLASIRA
jgi:hypothetical protein